MKIYRSYLLIILLIGETLVIGQDDNSFSIESAEAYGVENNNKVKNSLLDAETARLKVWETTAIGLPQVNVEGSFQHMIDIPTSVVDAQLFNPFAQPGEVMSFQMGQKFTTSASLNVSQLIFDGSYIVGLRFSKFYTKMAATAVSNTEKEVKAMVREAYYNVLIADKNVSLMDSILLSTQQLWEKTKIFEEAGMLSSEEVSQVELAVNRVNATRSNAVRQSEIARNLLKLQMGFDIEKKIELSENLEDVMIMLIESNPALQEFNVANNSIYMMLDQQKTLDEFSLQNEKAAYLPSAGAFFTHSQSAYRDEMNFFSDNPWYPTTVWGVSLSIPITSSGQKVVRVQQAEIKIEQDQNNLDQVEESLKFQEMQLKSAFISAFEIMKIEKENVVLSSLIYKNAITKEGIGTFSTMEVTRLQQDLLNAEGAYIMSVFELLNVKIQLDKLYNQ